MADALEAWQPICDRIKAQVPGLRAVLPAWDLAAVTERTQVVPAVHVVYDGEDPIEQSGRRVLEEQRFLVVIVVRNVRDCLGGSGAAEDAKVLRAKVLEALTGFSPTPNHKPMQRAKARATPHYTPGFAYLPIAFTTRSTNP